MTGVAVVVEDLHEAEIDLHLELERIAERHAADHEVAHVMRDLARWSAKHVEQLAGEGRRFGLELEEAPRPTNPVAAGVRRKSSELLGRRQSPALLLLNDLRQLYGAASLVRLDWQLLAQLAKARQDKALLAVAESCRAETQRQVTWAETKLKESVVQALARP